MTVYPVRASLWFPAAAGGGMLFAAVALILMFGPSGTARAPGVLAGVVVAAFGMWLAWSTRRWGYSLDGTRLRFRAPLPTRNHYEVDLADAVLITDPLHAVVKERTWKKPGIMIWVRRDTPRLSERVFRHLAASSSTTPLNGSAIKRSNLYPFVVEYGNLNSADAGDLQQRVDTAVAGAVNLRSELPVGPFVPRRRR